MGALPRARPQGPDDVRPDDRGLVDLHRQPGHRPGHLRDFRRGRAPALRRRPRGPLDPDRRPRRHGRRAAARGELCRRVVAARSSASSRASTSASARATSTSRRATRRRARAHRAAHASEARGVGRPARQRRRNRCPSWCAARRRAGRGPTSSPTRPRRTTSSTAICPPAGRSQQWKAAQAEPEHHAALREAAARSCAVHVQAMLGFQKHRAFRSSTTATTSARSRSTRASPNAFAFPGFRSGLHPAALLPRQGAVPLGGAVAATPRTSAKTDAKLKELFPERHAPAPLARHGRRAHRVPGTAGAHLLARPRRAPSRWPRVQRDGEVGRAEGADRDRPRPPRLRLGRARRTARPRRCATAATPSPTGRCSTRCSTPRAARPGCRCTTAAASAWATRSTPASSSSATAATRRRKRIERVLWNDPATGVMRHADAGYEEAIACAREQGLKLPMLGAMSGGALDAALVGRARRSRSCSAARRRRRRSRSTVAAARADPRQRRGGAARGRRRRSRVRRQHRLRQARRDAHRRRATSTLLQLNLIRSHSVGVGAPLAPAGRAADAGAEGGQPRARPLGRARERSIDALARRRTTPGSCRYVPSQGSVGASGDLAPLAHLTLALIGEGELWRDGERVPAAARAARRRPRAARARREGGAGADQRHAGLDRAGAARAASAFEPVLEAALVDRRADGRRRARQRRPVRPAHPRAARPAGTDRRRALLPRAARRQRDPPLAPAGRRSRPGSVQPALPAAGGRRMPRPAAPRGARPRARGERGHRQPARLRRRRRRRSGDRVGRQLPRRAGRARGRRDGARRSPRSARSPSGGSRC